MGPAPYTFPAACRETIAQVRLDHGFRRKGPGAFINAPRRQRFQPTAEQGLETASSPSAGATSGASSGTSQATVADTMMRSAASTLSGKSPDDPIAP